ncbi:hypothetical protein UlMin_015088 [Ulmus minor]
MGSTSLSESESEPNSSIFRPGATVEVIPDEPGFHGSFYLATIIRHRAPNSVVVQYKTLVDAKSKPLREVIGVSQLRPLLPPESKWDFGMGDDVDVYDNEGWWEGVVMEDLGNGRFQVFFGAYKQYMEFSKEDMRQHRKWVNGNWVPPLEEEDEAGEEVHIEMKKKRCKATREEKFEKGAAVEISSDEDGFQGAWFAASIVETLGNDKFLAEYENFKTDDGKEFLREEIDLLHIRPRPPQLKVDHFKLFEEVDSLYNDGWWVGVISKVLRGSKYLVYFRSTNEELEFHHSELRVHQDWIGGIWVVASQALKL